MTPNLKTSLTPGATASGSSPGGVTLKIPPGPAGYRLAQLDDYHSLARRGFPHHPPCTLSLRARASASDISGTWGFGLWNDPFGLKLGFGGGQKIPCLPNACWFFGASPHNYLSFRNDQPAQGFLVQTFRSPRLPGILLAPGVLALPLLALPPLARLLRKLASRLIGEDASPIPIDPSQWHTYSLEWLPDRVTFRVDGILIHQTTFSPRGPLGLVIWLDNQYAAWGPDGRAKWGTLASEANAWLEIEALELDQGGVL